MVQSNNIWLSLWPLAFFVIQQTSYTVACITKTITSKDDDADDDDNSAMGEKRHIFDLNLIALFSIYSFDYLLANDGSIEG